MGVDRISPRAMMPRGVRKEKAKEEEEEGGWERSEGKARYDVGLVVTLSFPIDPIEASQLGDGGRLSIRGS